jgi:hypothetical protein
MELLQTIVSGGLISVVTGIASTLITMHYQKKQFILEKKLEKIQQCNQGLSRICQGVLDKLCQFL